jgi:CheY-like chemotaxis protein
MPINILLYDPNEKSRQRFVQLLMYQKFVAKAVDNLALAVPELATGAYRLFICTVSPQDAKAQALLKTLRETPEKRGIIPLVLLEHPTQELVQRLIAVGCAYFLLKDAPQELFLQKVEEIAQTLGDRRDLRQFTRIDIPEYEKAQILVTSRNGGKCPGRVANISMGGILVVWDSDRPFMRIIAGDAWPNCLLVVKSLDLYVDLRVVSVFEKSVGTQFYGLNEERMGALCKFVYERVLSDNKLNPV